MKGKGVNGREMRGMCVEGRIEVVRGKSKVRRGERSREGTGDILCDVNKTTWVRKC